MMDIEQLFDERVDLPLCLQVLDHRMADKDRTQTGSFVELGLEWKNAEHQVEPARHLRDAPPVPGPDLRADVVDDFRA